MHVPQTEVILRHASTELARVTLPPGEYVIGRNPDVEIHADTPLISRRHARLTINYDHLLLEDLGSRNGTFVADQPITTATRLFPNQSIRLGPDITLEVRRERAPSEPGVSLAPMQEAVRRVLPEEVLTGKRYAIGQQVARGGMGAILAAQQQALQRPVAMKVMLDSVDPGDALRFIEEAQVTGQLAHPNIVPVYELGVDEQDQLFYTMKFVRGVTLKKIIELLAAGTEATVKKYPLGALLTIFQKVCDAVAFAHSRGVIHRDLKPENIMLGDFGEVLVMDWGLAKKLGERRAETGNLKPEDVAGEATSGFRSQPSDFQTFAGTIMGTPQYMAPEQARGEVETMDQRADIYALGAILFHILTLRPSVTGGDAMAIVDKVGRGEIEPLECGDSSPLSDGRRSRAGDRAPRGIKAPMNRRTPQSLAAVVRKAMALDPAARYESVPALQADIEAFQNGFATSAEKAGLGKQLLLALKRHKIAAAGVAAVLLVGATLGTKSILESKRAEREAVRATAALADLKKSAPALLELAESEAGFQRFDSALVKLDAALALDPALTAGWWRRAWLLLGMARYGEAPAAFRTAQQRDPAQHAHDALLPVLDAIAAAPDDATRFPPERTEALFRHFTKVGASGELNALSQRLTLGAKQKEQMVRKRLDEWLGKDMGVVHVQPDGAIKVFNLPKATDTLEPLRGLPIGYIALGSTVVKSLEPLRGMALTYLNISNTHISDLSPLRGMPLTELHADESDISDLTPLAGMPLRRFSAPGTKITDISPLRGAPLEEFHVATNRIVDFSPLRGAPLKKVRIVMNQCSDLSFLADSPALEYLECGGNSIADLTPLRGKPLKFLNASGNRITDLRPLKGLPLMELIINDNPIADYAPLRELRQLQKLHIPEWKKGKVSLEPLRQHPSLQYLANGFDGPYRPVAEFWADYDAQQAAGKK